MVDISFQFYTISYMTLGFLCKKNKQTINQQQLIKKIF